MKILKISVLILFVLLIMWIDPGFSQGLPGLPDTPPKAPIDGGLGLLAGGGIAYAVKKLRDKKKAE